MPVNERRFVVNNENREQVINDAEALQAAGIRYQMPDEAQHVIHPRGLEELLRQRNRKQLTNVTVGADPELFIYNNKTGKVVSSIGLIPGEKGNAWVKEGWEKGFGLEIDNILAEYNIPAVTTLEDWLRVHNFMKDEIRKFIQEKNPDLDIRHRASYLVDEDQLDNEIAKLFGWKAAA